MEKLSYTEQVQHPLWKARRLEIIQKGNYRCEDCSKPFPKGFGLEVHHCCYLTGKMAWEYPDELLMPLCRSCHEHRQGRQDAAFLTLGKFMRRMSKLELEDAIWTFLARDYYKMLREVGE